MADDVRVSSFIKLVCLARKKGVRMCEIERVTGYSKSWIYKKMDKPGGGNGELDISGVDTDTLKSHGS